MMQEEAGATEPATPAMSDQQRAALVAKMDRELEEHFAELEARAAGRGGQVGKSRVEGFNEDNWEEEMAKHPFFNEEWKEGKELSPLMQGMQDLKYSPDENTPEELARSYKEDGNFNFKCKKYRFAVASYTEGLRAKSSEVEVNTQLVTNRAAAQFHLGNLRSCLLDCKLAVRLDSGHMKAIVRFESRVKEDQILKIVVQGCAVLSAAEAVCGLRGLVWAWTGGGARAGGTGQAAGGGRQTGEAAAAGREEATSRGEEEGEGGGGAAGDHSQERH